MSIERTIHQIWLGPKMPENYRLWCRKMQQINPDWNYRLWREDVLDRYADDPYVAWMKETGERTAFLVDRLRVLLLRDDGGLYCDADCFPVQSFRVLDEVWDDPRIEFVAGMRSPDRRHVSLNTPGLALVDNTFFASAKGGKMAHRLCNLYQANSRKHTGFSMGKEILRNASPSTLLLGYKYFYAETPNPEMILSHDSHNAYSWGKPNKEAVTGVTWKQVPMP